MRVRIPSLSPNTMSTMFTANQLYQLSANTTPNWNIWTLWADLFGPEGVGDLRPKVQEAFKSQRDLCQKVVVFRPEGCEAGVELSTLWWKGTPFAVIHRSGKHLDYFRDWCVTDVNILAVVNSYMMGYWVKSLEEGICFQAPSNPDKPEEWYTLSPYHDITPEVGALFENAAVG